MNPPRQCVKRCAVVDGMNLLHTASRGAKTDRFFELDAIIFLAAAKEMLRNDFDVRIFVPIKSTRCVKNKQIFQDLEKLGIFEFTQSNYDDVVILQYAAAAGGFVVSRDKFRDILPRMNMVNHVKDRCCHFTFVTEKDSELEVSVVDKEAKSEPKDEWDDSVENPCQEPLTVITEAMFDPKMDNLHMFYSHEGDFDFSSAQNTRGFFTETRRSELLDAVERAFEKLYNSARRWKSLSLTTVVYLMTYFRSDELKNDFAVLENAHMRSAHQVLNAKQNIKFWFSKALNGDVVETVLEQNPTSVQEMWKQCNEEMKRRYCPTGRKKDLKHVNPYDDPYHPAATSLEIALYELDLE
ncbi:hypothetical protein L596_008891 [Steinernema carpocapsae]|uniref:RNase NYN domain-containing protein n=1 Tax=Steinernema carpocapsae TaxID=34508 RepID=A0A4U5PDS9_STECR|nr:hypothetical protein L596_008891 [Steinernema carpocapsae]